MTGKNIQRASLTELRRMSDEGKLIKNLSPQPGEDLPDDFWDEAEVVDFSKESRSVHLRLDSEVFDYFKAQGKGHITRMQNVLKAYARAHSGGNQR
jgi:uncharacterized protein (DUF4415 family)